MKKINKDKFIEKIKDLCISVNYDLSKDVLAKIKESKSKETSDLGKNILSQLIENAKIAKKDQAPLCQDTGFVVVFVELGRDIALDFDLQEALDEGVRQGYKAGYLRNSIVKDPFNRENTKDNTPCIFYLKSTAGDKLKVTITPKGGGSENMSALQMFTPADGIEVVKDFVIQTVRNAGANVCPPSIVGIGIGGTFEKCALLAKEALLRELGSSNKDPFYDKLEKELLQEINKLGIGPMGMGGNTTCLGVFIKPHPCHIASLPVAVNMQCHSARHGEIIM